MIFNQIIPDILEQLFDTKNELSKAKYIDLYSKIYQLVNCLEEDQYQSFENCINDYLKTLVGDLFSCLNSNIDIYFDFYETYLEKSKLADKIFIYYQNEKCENVNKKNELISYLYNSVWDEFILTQFYPFILEDIKSIKNLNLDLDLFSKIEKYSLHINTLNNQLNNTFKYHIFDVIKSQKDINVDKLLELINYYDKILNIFDDDKSKEYLKNNIRVLFKENEESIYTNIKYKFIDIKSSLKEKPLESYNIYSNLHKLTYYFNSDDLEKYNNILFNVLKQTEYDNIETLIRNINISEFMLKTLIPKYSSIYEENNKYNYKYILEQLLEKTLKDINENFDNNFNIELVKFVNKNINNILYLQHINIIINNLLNKETFCIYYKKALKSRLLNGNISNINNESYLINILTKNDDLIDVSRMLVMLKDYQKSIVYSSEYNSLFNNNAFVNLTTYDMWGLTPYEYEDTLLCKDFRDKINLMKNDFKTYYLINNENRNVKFVDNVSTCFIDFNNVELECNYLQADLLYLFNENKYIDLNEKSISDNLLNSFIRPKILLQKESKLYVNEKFKYSKPSLKLYKLYKPSIEKTKSKVDKDLQSLIFKKEDYIDCFIMKFLKKNINTYFDSTQIYNSLQENLKSKFNIDKELYDKRITRLKDNLYIEISENNIKYLI
jgi:hypothetical protein